MIPTASVILPLLLGLASAQYEETIEHLTSVQPEENEVIHNESERAEMYQQMLRELPMEDGGQMMMFQGDMVMSKRELLDMYALEPSRSMTWPGGIVPYKISESLENEAALIRQGIAHWMNHSCLTFLELQKHEPTTDCILFVKGKRCSSRLGHVGSVQNISIGDGCENLGTVVHEIGHAIGFLHEQSRADRNRYVVVNYPNIQYGKRRQFDPDLAKREYGARYDYTSVMHYSPTAFATSPEMKTISPVNPLLAPLIRQQNGLSFRDRRKANFLYQCDAACTSKPECANEGFVDNTCKCVCPPNTEGERCEILRRSYYRRPNCGGRVIREKTIASPGYPWRQRPQDGVCVWWIQAPANRKVQLTFRAFELFNRVHGFCRHDRFEIRLQSLYMGKTYCSDEIKPGEVVTSVGRHVIIEYRPYAKFKRGFAAKVKFVPV